MTVLTKILQFACIILVSGQVYAATKQTEFSADAVITMPNVPTRVSKLYVGKDAVRRESTSNGQTIIEIVYKNEGKAVLINEHLRSYRENTFDLKKQNNDINPCEQIKNAICEKLGKETIDGMKTEKWQIISNENGRKMRTLHWVDTKRKLALREFFPDGSVAELKRIKKEKLNGRNTEKWRRELNRPDGSSNDSYQWYDTGLGIAIREELPGGFIRELKNIKIANQPASLFKVPEDYRKIEEYKNTSQIQQYKR